MPTTTNNGWSYPSSTDLVKDGATNFQTLATGIDTSTGKGLIAWQSYAPTLSAGWANGNGIYTAYYCQIGKIVHVSILFQLGSTTTKGTGMAFTLPVTAKRAADVPIIAYGNPAGSTTMFGGLLTTTLAYVYALGTAGAYIQTANVTATVPATWATGNTVSLAFTYEAA